MLIKGVSNDENDTEVNGYTVVSFRTQRKKVDFNIRSHSWFINDYLISCIIFTEICLAFVWCIMRWAVGKYPIQFCHHASIKELRALYHLASRSKVNNHLSSRIVVNRGTIKVTSHERDDVLFHRPSDCLFRSIAKFTRKTYPNFASLAFVLEIHRYPVFNFRNDCIC